MPAGWAAAAVAASAASTGVQASAGKKGAEAASAAQLAGLGDANKVIRDAMAQYGPRVAGGNQAYGQMQNFYGQATTNPNRALSAQEKKRLATLQKRIDAGGSLSSKEQGELNKIQGLRAKRKKYSEDFNLAETVGQEQEQGLLELEKNFAPIEEGIYAQQEQAMKDYTARNAGLDAGYKSEVGAMDTGFQGATGALDTQYWGEERALRDKIAAGDVTLDPGYKFRLEQGQLARERGAAAKGGLLSGGHIKDELEFSQGLASQEFGAATGRLYDLLGLGKDAYTQKRGNLEGDYERGRGYKTGDYSMARDYGTKDYGLLQAFHSQNLNQRRGTFDRKYGQGTDQRNFAIDRFGRRVGGVKALSDQGFDAMNQRSNLSGSLASLYSQAGQARGAGARAGYDALGQGLGGALDDLSFLGLLYGQGGLDRQGMNTGYKGRQDDLNELWSLRGRGRGGGQGAMTW